MRRKSITTKQIHADHWEPHESVVIRSLNTEDSEIIQDGLADVDSKKGVVSAHSGRQRRLTLQRAIVSWTFTDAENRPLPSPPTEADIKALADEDSLYIFEQIQELNKPLSDSEKKD